MDRRKFLKKTSVIAGMGLVCPAFANTKNIKNKYHFIMPPKPFDFFVKEGKKKGGRILIIGGIHGNEEGGFKSSNILVDTEVTKGTLAILPRSNPESIFTDIRGYNGDMNRKFAHLSKKDKDYYKIHSIKQFIQDFKPDVVLSLHDGYGFFRHNPRWWGESIVIDEAIYKNINLYKQALYVSESLKKNNLNIPIHNTRTFEKNSNHKEQRMSLTYYVLKHHNIPSFCIEASKQTKTKRKLQIHLVALREFFRLYNVEISPSFEHILSNIDSYLTPKKTQIIASINNQKTIIKPNAILKVPKGTEIKFYALHNRGAGLLAKGISANYKSFFYSAGLEFLVKNDNLTEYNFIIT